jgi:branched-chain amino acid transport system substrate-binding protein
MKRKKMFTLASLFIMALFVFATSSQAAPEKATLGEAKGPIKIGFIGRLSAPYGLSNKTALETSVEDLNAEGGILGQPVQLLVNDSKGEIPLVVAAYKKLVMTEQCALIVVEGTEPVFSCMEGGANCTKNFPISCSACSFPMTTPPTWSAQIMISTNFSSGPFRKAAPTMIRS